MLSIQKYDLDEVVGALQASGLSIASSVDMPGACCETLVRWGAPRRATSVRGGD